MLGGSNAPWISSGVEREQFRLVRTRHEDTAVGAAGGYSRANGSIGVASVTRGPGFANAVNALMAQAQSHVPVLLITGQSPTTKRPSMQNINQQIIAQAVGAGFHHVADATELERAFWIAIRDSERDGHPQVLSIGDGILASDVPELHRGRGDVERQDPDPASVEAAVDLLERARRPIILAGVGAVLANCRQDLVELAEVTGAHLATTLRALNLFTGHDHDLGLAGGWTPGRNRPLFSECDVALVVGASLNDYTTDLGRLMPTTKIIRCDIEESVVSGESHGVIGDAAASTRALLDEWRARGLKDRPPPPRATTHNMVVKDALSVDVGHDSARGLDPREVYTTLDRVLPEDRVVVTDSGRFLGTVASLVPARDVRSWLIGNSFGSIGQGLGTAVGAATAHPGRPTILITGDGGFMTSSHDLDSVRLNHLDLTVVIINDELYGSDAKYLTNVGLPLDVITQTLPDIPLLAQAFGGRGEVVRKLDQLEVLRTADAGLRLFDVRVDPHANVREVTSRWATSGAP